jgi:hypothetical protein
MKSLNLSISLSPLFKAVTKINDYMWMACPWSACAASMITSLSVG